MPVHQPVDHDPTAAGAFAWNIIDQIHCWPSPRKGQGMEAMIKARPNP